MDLAKFNSYIFQLKNIKFVTQLVHNYTNPQIKITIKSVQCIQLSLRGSHIPTVV